MRDTTKPTILKTAKSFLMIGLQGFGGLGAVLALINRDVVERRQWLSKAHVTEALTYTKLLPGSTVVQVVAYLGWKLHGFWGAMVTTVAFLLPAFLVMLGLAVGYRSLESLVAVPAALSGLTAAVVGILVMTTWTLGHKNITGLGEVIVTLVALIASVHYEVNPALIVVAAGLLAVFTEARKKP